MRLKFLYFFIAFFFITHYSVSQNVKELNALFDKSINNDLNAAHELACKAVKMSLTKQDENLILDSFTNLSKVYYRQNQNDSCSVYVHKAIDLSLKLNDLLKQSILYNRLGGLERRNGNYALALIHNQKSYQIANSNQYIKQICDAHNNLARLYKIRGDKKRFLEELESAIKLSKDNNQKDRLAESYNLKGISLFEKQKDSSIYYYNNALQLFKESENKYFEGIVYANLGDIYLNIYDYNNAFKNLKLSENIAKEIGNSSSLFFVNLSLGIYNIETENYPEGVSRYEIAMNEYKDYVDDKKLVTGYWLLSEGYFFNNQFKKAYKTQEKYISLNEKLLNAKKAKEFDEIRTKYEVEKKDNQIVLLEKDKVLSAIKRKWIIVSAILAALPLIGLFLFYRHRANTQKTIRLQELEIHHKEKARLEKEQELIQIKALVDGQDKERHRIAKELHDGVGGQLASVNLSLSEINSKLNNRSLHNIGNVLTNSFNELRALSHSLSSNYHKDKTLYSLLAELKKQYTSDYLEIEISIFPEDCLVDLNMTLKHNLYRIFQESFANVLKHANAKQVHLSINKHIDVFVIIIEDDGVGFELKSLQRGIGLKNIKERIDSINGKLSIDTSINNGTQLIIEIPLQNMKDA